MFGLNRSATKQITTYTNCGLHVDLVINVCNSPFFQPKEFNLALIVLSSYIYICENLIGINASFSFSQPDRLPKQDNPMLPPAPPTNQLTQHLGSIPQSAHRTMFGNPNPEFAPSRTYTTDQQPGRSTVDMNRFAPAPTPQQLMPPPSGPPLSHRRHASNFNVRTPFSNHPTMTGRSVMSQSPMLVDSASDVGMSGEYRSTSRSSQNRGIVAGNTTCSRDIMTFKFSELDSKLASGTWLLE